MVYVCVWVGVGGWGGGGSTRAPLHTHTPCHHILAHACCRRIPAEYLVGTKTFIGPDVADTPLIVFINAKSGGRVGPRLLTVLFKALGQAQVVSGGNSREGQLRKLARGARPAGQRDGGAAVHAWVCGFVFAASTRLGALRSALMNACCPASVVVAWQ